MSIKKLEKILSDEYGKIVLGKDVPILNKTEEGAAVYDQNWIEESWSRLLKEHGILCEEPTGDKKDWIHVARHGTYIKGVSVSFDDRTDCWIPLDLATMMLYSGKLEFKPSLKPQT